MAPSRPCDQRGRHLPGGDLQEDPATKGMVGLERFELSTPRLSSVCSNQLSYWPVPTFQPIAPRLKFLRGVRRALKAE